MSKKIGTGMIVESRLGEREPCFIMPNDIDPDDFNGLHVAAKRLLCMRQVSGRPKAIDLWKLK